MILLIVILLVVGFLLISTTHITGVNKTAVAMLMCTVGWVLYICWGTDFVRQEHLGDYEALLEGLTERNAAVKSYIYENIFLKYVGRAAAVVLFLLSTMTIVEILNSNGCFDFIHEWVRTRSTARFIWGITFFTFILSANLDTLTTTVLMLMIMHKLVRSRRQRLLIGAAIVIAANCGGCFTVIGDPTGLVLWGDGAVTASNFSASLALPALLAWGIPTLLIHRELPKRLDTEWVAAPYRGDDTRLNRWQRLIMLLVGLGGLWFIPTFHSITKLSPFLGALCVLSLLWVVNELFNRKLMQADQMADQRIPRVLQYGAIQQMLFVMGIMLGMGVMTESGVLGDIALWIDNTIGSVWLMGLISGLLSSLVDSFTIAITDISLYDIGSGDYATNGIYWKVVAYSTAVGGCLLAVGSASGLALMKTEHMRVGWYARHILPKVLIGWLAGLLTLWLEYHFWFTE